MYHRKKYRKMDIIKIVLGVLIGITINAIVTVFFNRNNNRNIKMSLSNKIKVKHYADISEEKSDYLLNHIS